ESAELYAEPESITSLEESRDVDEAHDFTARLGQRQGLGRPLPDQARAFLESRFGVNLSPVRVHTGAEAHALADAVNATAFTTGADIFFRDGAYSPASSEGMRLLAHEATHVVQQSLGPVDGTSVEGSDVAVSDPSDRFEQEADQVAGQLMSGFQNIGHPA